MTSLPTIDEALALVLARVSPLDAEEVAVGEADGRILAVDARAELDLPPFDSSAMDGYAVRAVDTPGTLRLVGESAAGAPAERGTEPGEAIAISTGAVVPSGADAVVPVELTSRNGDGVTVEGVRPGDNVRPRGGDIHAGDAALGAGTRLGPAQLGALAAIGLARVACARRPRAAIVVTGTELRPAGADLAAGEIYESNSVLLAAQLRTAGAEPAFRAQAEDDPQRTRDVLAQALEHDVVITSGGVSVGEHDLVRGALGDLGAEAVFWRVAVKPGKPVAFWTRGRTLVFGLPGNPVSSLVDFELFVRPALLALQGAATPGPVFRAGRLGRPVRRNDGRDELVRARFDAGVLQPIVGQESHMIARASTAEALVLVPRGQGELTEGAEISWLPL